MNQSDEGMTKYGVDEGDPQKEEKTAQAGCPKCGGDVVAIGSVKSCVNCGTEPFEKR